LTLGCEGAMRMRVFREARHSKATAAAQSAPHCKD
jgi:hypothetical protein